MNTQNTVIAEPKAATKIIANAGVINNINYRLDSGNGIEFGFTYKCEGFKKAYLQLPNTPDSQHTIDGEDFDSDNEYHSEVFETLRDHFYADFKDVECAKASVFTGTRIIHVEQIDHDIEMYDIESCNSHTSTCEFYVAFSHIKAYVLIEGRASDYYNVFYFDEADVSSDDKELIVSSAEKQFFAQLKTEIKKALESGTDAQHCDDIVGKFMNDNFEQGWCDESDLAMGFYEAIACDCRCDREYELDN